MDELTVDNINAVLTALEGCETKYYNLGLKLGLNVRILQLIERNHDDVTRRFIEVVKAWLEKADDVCGPISWESLVTALKATGEVSIAIEIERKKVFKGMYIYCPIDIVAVQQHSSAFIEKSQYS